MVCLSHLSISLKITIIENGQLHWQPFMNSHCQFLILWNQWPPKGCSPNKINYTCQFIMSVPPLMLHSHLSLMCCSQVQSLAVFKQSAQFADMTCLLRHPHTPLPTDSEFQFRSTFCKNWITLWTFVVPSFQYHCHWTSTYCLNSIFLTSCCAICWMLPLQLLPPTK